MSLFVTSTSKVDKEALQEYVLKKLMELKIRFEEMLLYGKGAKFWEQVKKAILKMQDKEKMKEMLLVYEQLVKLPMYVDTWMRTAVDSKQRFEFFIKAKASEINSGDELKDYFWGLQIRHDQMVALVRVLTTLANQLELMSERPAANVLREPIILGLVDYSIEDQVYLEAEKVKVERDKLSK